MNTESTYDWEHSQWTVPLNFFAQQLERNGGDVLYIFTFGVPSERSYILALPESLISSLMHRVTHLSSQPLLRLVEGLDSLPVVIDLESATITDNAILQEGTKIANSRHPFHDLPLPWDLPPRTPGPLGHNDQADPNTHSRLGDTPGPLGINDHADPNFPTSLADLLNMRQVKRHRVSYFIPQPKSVTPPLITLDDIKAAAKAFDVEAAAIYAVSEVECGGRSGFDSKGRPKVLFEARWFHKFTAAQFDCSHPHLSQPTWEGARRYYGRGQWRRLLEAVALDPESALKSASWGKFQVMGFNHSGFKNVFDFCDGMFRSEEDHLRSFLAYCRDHGLIRYLKARDWERFAIGYNGSGYKENRYDEKLQNAYDNFKKCQE